MKGMKYTFILISGLLLSITCSSDKSGKNNPYEKISFEKINVQQIK